MPLPETKSPWLSISQLQHIAISARDARKNCEWKSQCKITVVTWTDGDLTNETTGAMRRRHLEETVSRHRSLVSTDELGGDKWKASFSQAQWSELHVTKSLEVEVTTCDAKAEYRDQDDAEWHYVKYGPFNTYGGDQWIDNSRDPIHWAVDQCSKGEWQAFDSFLLAPIAPDGEVLTHPKVHHHHGFLMSPKPMSTSGTNTNENFFVAGYTDSDFSEHDAFGCHVASACAYLAYPPGHALIVPGKPDDGGEHSSPFSAGMLQDFRPMNSEAMEWYIEARARRVPKHNAATIPKAVAEGKIKHISGVGLPNAPNFPPNIYGAYLVHPDAHDQWTMNFQGWIPPGTGTLRVWRPHFHAFLQDFWLLHSPHGKPLTETIDTWLRSGTCGLRQHDTTGDDIRGPTFVAGTQPDRPVKFDKTRITLTNNYTYQMTDHLAFTACIEKEVAEGRVEHICKTNASANVERYGAPYNSVFYGAPTTHVVGCHAYLAQNDVRISPGRELTAVAMSHPIESKFMAPNMLAPEGGYLQHSVNNIWMTWDQFNLDMSQLAEVHLGKIK